MGEVYYDDLIKKRELKDRWVQFWARLIGEKIYLYVSKDCKELDFCEIIWLSSCSRCTLLKRRNYSFRFRLTTSEGNYYFKCDSNLQRHRWIHMIHLACSGRSPELPPNHINMRCCYQDKEPNEIGNGKDKRKSHRRENINEERAPEMSDGKEASGEDEVSKDCSRAASAEDVELRGSKLIIDENNRSIASEESVIPEEMTTNSERTCKESENELKEEKEPCEMANDKTTTASSSEDSPATRQTFSFKTFTFSSFRKSLRRQSYPPKQSKELTQSKDQIKSVSYANFEDKIKYSMDNPAFTDDDSLDNVEGSTCTESYPKTKIINVVSCRD
ncbi:uncharacterized protein LOC116300974 [Actinia tenebrosa]|uniref:Uncharacterized protein LOC116300974 n=1 Tax=Actinia tenebrosa TaxID=6105 RepID=A0A6P8IGH1_ACTTE|nr:uncharacterized protein LOC116300974 [Actinia tenebrosa]